MPRVNLLIADDVGLGKTIEAGLVVQELLLRHRARTVLVVCPAALTREVAGRDARPVRPRVPRSSTPTLLRQLRRDRGVGANPFTRFPRLIVSIDWLKRPTADAAAATRCCRRDARAYPAPLRPADRRRGAHVRARRARAATPSTRSAPRRSGASRRTSSTGCSCRPRRTTATRRASPRCSSCSTRSASPAASSPTRTQLARVLVRRLKRSCARSCRRTRTARRGSPSARSSPIEVDYPDDEREAHASCSTATPSCARARRRRDGAQRRPPTS